MAKFVLDFGAEVEMITKGELDESLKGAAEVWAAQARTVKWMVRAIPLGQQVPTTYTIDGPRSGFAWDVKQITGTLTGGPESVAAYVGSGGSLNRLIGYAPPQASATAPNQNVFVLGWSSHQVILRPDEQVYVATSGAFRFRSLMISAVEVAAERLGTILA